MRRALNIGIEFMINRMLNHLVRLRPRDDTLHVCQGRTVLATSRDGFICDGPEHGLFVHETRLLSRYRHLIDGKPPMPVALSNVEQHSWLGYYITLPPGIKVGEPDRGSGQMREETEQTLELRLSRYVGDGVHEDIDLTNFSQQTTSFRFELEIDADFADVVETKGEREQRGEIRREWRASGEAAWELAFDYKAEHRYDHQGERGTARIHRCLTLRVENSSSAPRSKGDRVIFDVALVP